MLQKSLNAILTASILSIGLAVMSPVQAQSGDRPQVRQMENSKPPKTMAEEVQKSSAQSDVTERRGTAVRTMGPRDKEPELMMDFEPRRNGIRE